MKQLLLLPLILLLFSCKEDTSSVETKVVDEKEATELADFKPVLDTIFLSSPHF